MESVLMAKRELRAQFEQSAMVCPVPRKKPKMEPADLYSFEKQNPVFYVESDVVRAAFRELEATPMDARIRESITKAKLQILQSETFRYN